MADLNNLHGTSEKHEATPKKKGVDYTKAHANKPQESAMVKADTVAEIDRFNMERINTIADVKSPADLSRYIQKSKDKSLQILEQKIGIDKTWKIFVLTGAYTAMTLGTGFAKSLELGEPMAKATIRSESITGDSKHSATYNKAMNYAWAGNDEMFKALGLLTGGELGIRGVNRILNMITKLEPETISIGDNFHDAVAWGMNLLNNERHVFDAINKVYRNVAVAH